MPVGIDVQLQKTEWWQSLPFPLEACKVSSGTRPEGFRFHSDIVNIEAVLKETSMIVCGEANCSELAMTKAVAELIERSALWTWNKANIKNLKSSNGWAAHISIEAAKQSAILELIERDAVLAQWYSSTPFLEIDPSDLPFCTKKWRDKELSKSEFPIMRILISTKGIGPSVTCVFMNKKGNGVVSHATREFLSQAIESAIAEACRAAHLYLRKAFWEDTLSIKYGQKQKIDPGAHSVYYAYHETLPGWMFGNVVSWTSASQYWEKSLEQITFEEFKFQKVLEDPLIVGFAEHQEAFNLEWGPTDINSISKMAASRRLSPNKTEWNLNPHIIS